MSANLSSILKTCKNLNPMSEGVYVRVFFKKIILFFLRKQMHKWLSFYKNYHCS